MTDKTLDTTIEVLLVEDNPGDAFLVRELLGDKYLITCCSRCAEACDLLKSQNFDVVLLDMGLPDSSGISTLTTVMGASDTTPIVVLTGNDDESLGLEAVKLGAQDFLTKGLQSEQELRRIVRYAIERMDIRLELEATRSELAKANERLTILATTDPLTGISNRRQFFDKLTGEISRTKRTTSPLSVALLDLDFFKHINDKYGHAIGDTVLIAFTRTVQNLLRDYDTLGRIGGEEFALCMPETDKKTAEIVCDRLRQAFASQAFEAGGTRFAATCSIGIAQFASHADTADDLVARADDALYRAKEKGRNRVEAAA